MPAENQGTAGGAKPNLSFWQIWNMCFGFLGLQFGFALQNANVSRIFQTLGASLEQVPLLWIAAPFTGLLVQPLIGYFSDRTWTRLSTAGCDRSGADAALTESVDGRGAAVDAGCRHQCVHGAVPRVRG